MNNKEIPYYTDLKENHQEGNNGRRKNTPNIWPYLLNAL